MPYWSIGEWRARIGSSWCALGRPFKMRSPFRGKTRRGLTLNQGVATLFLLIMSIGVNLGLRTLVARGHHLPLLNFCKGGTIPDRMYLINLGLVLTVILQITSALVYQLLSMAIKRSKAGIDGDLSESLSFRTCFAYYSIFLILKMINSSMHPDHLLILSVIQTVDCLISLTVLWKALANKQDLVEKLHYVDTKVEVVMMTKLQGTWVLAVAKAVLDVTLSVAACVILSLLLISGDVEENPGPVGDLDYNSVDNNQVLSEDDLTDVMEEVLDIKSMWFDLGLSLRLRSDDLEDKKYPNESDCDAKRALINVLLLWLKKKYNVEKFGPPTWRMLVEAVNKKTGGNNQELAKQIALSHPAVGNPAKKRHTDKGETMKNSNVEEIKRRFSALLNNVRSALEGKGVRFENVRQHLIDLFQDIDSSSATSFDELFQGMSLKGHWNFKHHSPVETLISTFLPEHESLMKDYDHYVEYLNGFYATIELIPYINLSTEESSSVLPLSSYTPDHYRRLKVVLDIPDRKITQLSMKYVQDVWKKIAREFDIPLLTAIVDKLVKSSLEITWLIQPYLCDKIATSVHKSTQFFRQQNIIYVAIDDHPIYDAKQVVPGNIPTSDFERVIDNLMDTHTETSLTLMDTSFTSPEAGNSTASLQEEIKQRACDTEDVLSINNIKEVLDEMWDYRARWKFIGIQLHIDTGTLDAIEKDCKTVDDCLLRMIKGWLRNSPRPTVTRESIRVALRSKHVSNAAAANTKSEVTDNKLEEFTAYLKSLYKAKTQASYSGHDHWPPSVTDKVFSLAMIMPEQVQRRNIDDQFVRETITGKIDDILQRKVPITLKQIFEKTEQKKILIEGAPGCGKSTLSLHICHEWVAGQLLKEYSQVILVKLREEVVQNAKSIADVLPKRDGTMGQNVEKDITACDGEGVLFIFDGWDELPEKAPGHSIIRDILECNKLHKSSVVITSRPISSMALHELVKTRIEILGFTKAELQKYFTGCLGDDHCKVKQLQQRIKENPVVEGSCYLPLNASILVHLFKCDGVLPHTQFGIFSALTCNCIFRHLKKKKEQLDIPGIKSLDKLPTAIQSQFECICEMAYKGVIEDHITFDLERSFNTLGLLQGVESFASGMPSHSYNFLHLSIQELLAAIHMATKMDPSEQVAQFKELFGRARFSAVFQFYAAKTKLKTQGMDEIIILVVQKCMQDNRITELTPHSGTDSDLDSGGSSLGHKSQPLLLSLLHCLFEAQDETLCQLVAKELKGKLRGLQNISLSPADCLSVGYFLTHCRQFEVYLGGCSMGADGCKALFRKDKKYDLVYLEYVNLSLG